MRSIIQHKRQAIGLSQRELSEMSGINFRTLQDYEQGRKQIYNASADVVYKLSHALNCHMEDLLIEYEHISSREYHADASHRMILYATSLSPSEKIGQVSIVIDDLVPCLKDSLTHEEVSTAVFKVESKSFLSKFNSKNGWHINWSKVPRDVDVYALITQDDHEVQGLIGLRRDPANMAVYIHWACTAPHNNLHEYGSQKFSGVGGHLFAIAVEKSFDYGYDGYTYGYANCRETLDHYIDRLGAIHHPYSHIFGFLIYGQAAQNLLEVYNYEWNNPS